MIDILLLATGVDFFEFDAKIRVNALDFISSNFSFLQEKTSFTSSQ